MEDGVFHPPSGARTAYSGLNGVGKFPRDFSTLHGADPQQVLVEVTGAAAQVQAASAAMPPPAPPARTGDVTIKDWEWLAMMISFLWMFDDPTIQNIVHSDPATASGVVRRLIPAREKELRKDTKVSASDAGYISQIQLLDEDWIKWLWCFMIPI